MSAAERPDSKIPTGNPQPVSGGHGGPGIVLASTAYAAGIINQSFFVSLVMLSIITSLAAGSWLERVADRLAGARRHHLRDTAEAAGEFSAT
jgi:hypothetical protein